MEKTQKLYPQIKLKNSHNLQLDCKESRPTRIKAKWWKNTILASDVGRSLQEEVIHPEDHLL